MRARSNLRLLISGIDEESYTMIVGIMHDDCGNHAR